MTRKFSYIDLYQYFKSKEWKFLARYVKMKRDFCCYQCEKKCAPNWLIIRRLNHNRLGRELVEDLEALCLKCFITQPVYTSKTEFDPISYRVINPAPHHEKSKYDEERTCISHPPQPKKEGSRVHVDASPRNTIPPSNALPLPHSEYLPPAVQEMFTKSQRQKVKPRLEDVITIPWEYAIIGIFGLLFLIGLGS